MNTAQTTPAAADPRPLAAQFARTFPDRPCCLNQEESNQFVTIEQRGYAPWHAALLAVRATWGLDEATAA